MKIGTIVTGHGEVHALPILVRRIAERLGVWTVSPSRPFRVPEGKLKKPKELERAVRFVASQVEPDGGVLIVLDADDACPAEDAPKLLASARRAVPDARIEVVMAKREYESWFLAAASSIAGKRSLPTELGVLPDAEALRDAKGWLGARMKRGYSETLDQPGLTAVFDLTEACAGSRSFDKLVRSLAVLLGESPDPIRGRKR